MPSSITIAVPEEVRNELAARAAVCGRTVEEYLRDELIALARRPSAAVWMARVRARKDALQNPAGTHCMSERDTAIMGEEVAAEDIMGGGVLVAPAIEVIAEPRRDVG